MRALIAKLTAVALVACGVGCLQLTGVSDYKVEETPVCQPPEGSACRVAPNCGCPDGQTCALLTAQGAGACQAAGSTPRGAACVENRECIAGHGCTASLCLPYCGGDGDCDTNMCEPIQTQEGAPIPGVGACVLPCDPANDTCGEGLRCLLLPSGRHACLPPS